MSKTHVFGIGYHLEPIMEASLRALWATNFGADFTVTIADAHYPLDRFRSLELFARIQNPEWWMGDRAARVIDLGVNKGLHTNYNSAIKAIGAADEDIVIAYDLDEFPMDAGWVDALAKALHSDPKLGWLSLSSIFSNGDCNERGYETRVVEGLRVAVPKRPCIIHGAHAVRMGDLRRVGGWSEPRPHYGYLEMDMWGKFNALGLEVGYLADYRVAQNTLGLRQPADYRAWKTAHVRGDNDNPFLGSFEEWLTAKQQ